MLSMGWILVILTTALLGLGVSFTVLWFRRSGARAERVRVRSGEAAGGSSGRPAER